MERDATFDTVGVWFHTATGAIGKLLTERMDR